MNRDEDLLRAIRHNRWLLCYTAALVTAIFIIKIIQTRG